MYRRRSPFFSLILSLYAWLGSLAQCRQRRLLKHIIKHIYGILVIKATRCTNFSNFFCYKTLHVSESSSVHHQEFFTVHTAMVCIILVPSWSCSQAVSKPVWHIPELCLQWKTPDDGQRNSPKHVEFYCKNKFEKLVHLVGFIIRIYHDARSPERQISIGIRCVCVCAFASYTDIVHNDFVQVVKLG